jgi:hypothetical protein
MKKFEEMTLEEIIETTDTIEEIGTLLDEVMEKQELLLNSLGILIKEIEKLEN